MAAAGVVGIQSEIRGRERESVSYHAAAAGKEAGTFFPLFVFFFSFPYSSFIAVPSPLAASIESYRTHDMRGL